MTKKEMLCPVCEKKVGVLRLISEQYFKCPKCKSTIEMKVINSIEGQELNKVVKMVTPLTWALLFVSFAGIFSNMKDNPLYDYAIFVFILQITMVGAVLVAFARIARKKQELFNRKELKLVVIKKGEPKKK